jgi:lambda family phage tail tape measure protein
MDNETRAGIRLTGDASGLNAAWVQAEQGAKKAADAAEAAGAKINAGLGKAGAEGATKLAAATKLTKNEMLQLNYTVSDVAASLASGASPFTILLQQGGQLKDSMGGIGPMFSKLGSFITPASVAITGLAAGVGTLAAAWYQGYRQNERFTQSMRLTGNYAGITAGQFALLAQRVAESTNSSMGQGREVMQSLVATGQFSGKALGDVGIAVTNVQKLTGQATDEIVADFASMSKGVAKWAEEHNTRYHFLGAAQYEYIRNLEEQGRTQEAMAVATNALNDSVRKQEGDVKTLSERWESFTNVLGKAWDKLQQLGRPTPTSDRLTEAEAELAARKKALNDNERELGKTEGQSGGGMYAESSRFFKVKSLRKEGEELYRAFLEADEKVASLRRQKESEEAAASKKASDDRIQQAGITASREYEVARKGFDRKAALAQELAAYDRRVAAMREAGLSSAPDATQEARDKAAIRDKYKAPTDRSALQAQEQAYRAGIASQEGLQRLEQDKLKSHLDRLDSLRRQGALSEEQVIEQRLQFEQAAIDKLIAISQREAEISKKAGKAGDTEKYNEEVKRLQAQRTDLERQAADDAATLTITRTRALQDFIVAERDSLDQQAFEASLIGKTTAEVERLTNSRRIDLAVRNATRNSDGSPKVDAATEAGYQGAGQAAKDQFKAKDAWKEGDWTAGAKKALEEYGATARTVAEQTRDALSSGFTHAAGAVKQFVTTGKANLKDFARSWLGDLAEIYAKELMVWAARSAMSAMGFSAGASFSGGTLANASGNAFSNGGLSAFADGTVLTRPTFFAFSNGGKPARGLGGEAGDEGLVPLARMRNGKLGVSTDGGGGGVEVNIYATEGTKARTEERQEGNRRIIDVFFEQVDSYLAGNMAAGRGELTSMAESVYGLNRAASATR